MPSTAEKLSAEVRNERIIRLWPEGKFFRAYERSAYLFVSQVRAYEVRRSHVQVVGQDVVSIGFPQSVLDTLEMAREQQGDGSVTLQAPAPLDEQAFQQWREGIPMYVRKREPKGSSDEGPQTLAATVYQPVAVESEVAGRIRRFNLADATPMQCMLLLSDLQRMLNRGHG